jgi:hypothetical protein
MVKLKDEYIDEEYSIGAVVKVNVVQSWQYLG